MKLKVNFIDEFAESLYKDDKKPFAWIDGDSGIDLRANIKETIVLRPGQRVQIPTGIRTELVNDKIDFVIFDEDTNKEYLRVDSDCYHDPNNHDLKELIMNTRRDLEGHANYSQKLVRRLERNDDIEIQVRPRSGLASKHGISMVNTPGTVDFKYRGEIGVILVNTNSPFMPEDYTHEPVYNSWSDFVINPGDRIGQLVICQIHKPNIEFVNELSLTDRGSDGFGSSGVK